MPKLKLVYFDFNGGRGEAARLALSLGGVPFEDQRVPVADWPRFREQMPFHALPVLEVDGEAVSQCNAINRYAGRLAGLYPDDPMEALRCDEVMDAVEDITTQVTATFGITDEAEKRTAREALAAGPIRLYLEKLDGLLERRGGHYFVADRLTIADLKVYVWTKGLLSGVLDHVPADLPHRFAAGLVQHGERIGAHPGVRAYYDAR